MLLFCFFLNCGDACRSSSYPLKGNWSLSCIHSWHSSHITHLSHCLTFILLSSSFINHKGFLKRACGRNLRRVFSLHMQSVYDFKHCLINSNYQVLFFWQSLKVFFNFYFKFKIFSFWWRINTAAWIKGESLRINLLSSNIFLQTNLCDGAPECWGVRQRPFFYNRWVTLSLQQKECCIDSEREREREKGKRHE